MVCSLILTSKVEPSPPLAVESSQREAGEDDTCGQEGRGDDAGVKAHQQRQTAKTEACTWDQEGETLACTVKTY